MRLERQALWVAFLLVLSLQQHCACAPVLSFVLFQKGGSEGESEPSPRGQTLFKLVRNCRLLLGKYSVESRYGWFWSGAN